MTRALRSNPPFRADHVGSLLRPRDLKEAAKAFQQKRLSEAEYLAVLDHEIARVVGLQEEAGLHSITDGEFGRTSWFGFFFERLQGFSVEKSLFRFKDAEGQTFEWMTCYASGRMRRTRGICTEEFARLSSLTSRIPKANMPAPSALHFFRGDDCRDPEVYPDIDEWWDDLIAIYREEIRALGRSGCKYLQLDEVPLAMLCDSGVREQIAALGLDPERLIRRYIEVVNRVLEVRPPDMTVCMHLCRGNFRSRWMAEGGYGPVAENLFNDLSIDGFFLEYDSERAGGFEPLRHVPKNKIIVLGLVTSKSPALERPDDLKRRIGEASKFVPLDQLALSPQCGFASVAGGNLLTEEEQMAKLRLIVETAEDVWR